MMPPLQPITPAIATMFKAIRLRALLDTPNCFWADLLKGSSVTYWHPG
ncbi:MAG: hypothetical protein QNJ55_25675 [Xenococcus sp. MO_188.B8]|nr:hypothetical protein [Xenococcus sp. MO_188.B8]